MSNKYIMQRGWMDMPIFAEEPFTEREAFCWLIENAVWQDVRKRCGNVIVSLKRGQLAFSIRFLAEKWRWHKSKTERFINRLKTETLIETDSSQFVNVITICQYNELQNFCCEYNPQTETQTETEARQHRDNAETKARQCRDKEEHQITPDNTGRTPDNTGITPRESIPESSDEDSGNPDFAFEKSLTTKSEIDKAVEAWNSIATELDFPRVRLDAERKRTLTARLRECGGISGWDYLLGKIRESPFLRGETERFRGVTFDWATKRGNFKKIMEGNYDERDRDRKKQFQQRFKELTKTERFIFAANVGDYDA